MKPDFRVSEHEVYLDSAATTAMDLDVVESMRPFHDELYGHANTVYRLGRDSMTAIENSKNKICDFLKCEPGELFFTSGGTESNNWAIKCVSDVNTCLVGKTEHASVIKSAESMQNNRMITLPVDKFGLVDLVDLEEILKNNSTLGKCMVSIQYGNNEIGTIQPVLEIADICHRYNAIYHCDAVQALGKIKFDVDDIGADLISFSSHKIHGPMGLGMLYVKEGISLTPFMHGSNNQCGMRSGILFTSAIVGFAKAIEIAYSSIDSDSSRLTNITNWLRSQLRVSYTCETNGHPELKLPHIVSVTIPGLESEVVCGIMGEKYQTYLANSSASATLGGGSHILKAIGKTTNEIKSTFRFSLSRFNSDREVQIAFGRFQSAIYDSKKRRLF